MSPPLHFYYSPGSCALAVHILLHELSLPFTSTQMVISADLGVRGADSTGPTREEYLAINPKGFVPALRVFSSSSSSSSAPSSLSPSSSTPSSAIDGDGGVTITELPALLTYLPTLADDSAQEIRLLGQPGLERAKIFEWLVWLSGTIHTQGFGAMWRPQRFTGREGDWGSEGEKRAAEEAGRVIGAFARTNVERAFRVIEGRMREGSRFVSGEEWTVVDAVVYVFWRWGKRIGLAMEEGFPRWTAVVREGEGREAVRRALREEGLEGEF